MKKKIIAKLMKLLFIASLFRIITRIMINQNLSSRIQSVSELTSTIRGLLETELPFVSVAGEISNMRVPGSGHLYFTLKDHSSQIRAVMFKHQQKYMQTSPDNGQEVLCRGRISVYEPRGEYQIILDMIEPLGAGKLMASFEKLKEKLASEGLFDDFHKKALPFSPEHITLITSTKGAAIHDFLTTLHDRHPGLNIDVFPVNVQGEGAAEEISNAIALINQYRPTDVIVLTRGGGSLEDLWAFNEEILARAIFASRIPVISAIGHETDFTISDFTADHRAATPTAAAAVVTQPKDLLQKRVSQSLSSLARALMANMDHLSYQVRSLKKHLGDPTLLLDNHILKLDSACSNMRYAFDSRLTHSRLELKDLAERLLEQNPARQLTVNILRVSEIQKRLRFAIRFILERKEQRFKHGAATLDAVSPLAVLGRGYSITTKVKTGEVIKKNTQLKAGDEIETILDQGSLKSRVVKTSSEKPLRKQRKIDQ